MDYEDNNLSIPDKINHRMNILELQMNNNVHLQDPNKVQTTIYSITKFWSVLNEEDKDYIQCAQHALEDKTQWGT